MEVFRIPPYPLTVTFTGLTADTDYLMSLYNSRTELKVLVDGTSDGDGEVVFELPTSISDYDDEYRALVHEGTLESDPVVASDNLKVVRPYLIPADITPVGGSLADYTKYERIARMQIDSLIGGFYYKQFVLDLQGQGADKLPIGLRVNDVVSVVRNNVIVFDRDEEDNEEVYTLSADHQSLIRYTTEEHNVVDGKYPTTIPTPSDFDGVLVRTVDFPVGWNFIVTVESGWSFVPQDIKEATQLLVDDMACMTPNYLNNYIREYETKDFRVDIHRPAFSGTGNLIVDQILQKYYGEILYDGIRVL